MVSESVYNPIFSSREIGEPSCPQFEYEPTRVDQTKNYSVSLLVKNFIATGQNIGAFAGTQNLYSFPDGNDDGRPLDITSRYGQPDIAEVYEQFKKSDNQISKVSDEIKKSEPIYPKGQGLSTAPNDSGSSQATS